MGGRPAARSEPDWNCPLPWVSGRWRCRGGKRTRLAGFGFGAGSDVGARAAGAADGTGGGAVIRSHHCGNRSVAAATGFVMPSAARKHSVQNTNHAAANSALLRPGAGGDSVAATSVGTSGRRKRLSSLLGRISRPRWARTVRRFTPAGQCAPTPCRPRPTRRLTCSVPGWHGRSNTQPLDANPRAVYMGC